MRLVDIFPLFEEQMPAHARQTAYEIWDMLADNVNFTKLSSGNPKLGNPGPITQKRTITMRLIPVDATMTIHAFRDIVVKKVSEHYQIDDIKIANMLNSGKFQSVVVSIGNQEFDIVKAAGQNQGEKFEEEVIKAISNFVNTGHASKLADSFLSAMENLEPDFDRDDLVKAEKQTASPIGRIKDTLENQGFRIADMILYFENSQPKYISLKNESGISIGNMGGASESFDNDFNIKPGSTVDKIISGIPIIDRESITQGFQDYSNETPSTFTPKVDTSFQLTSGFLLETLQKGVGYDYYYAKQSGDEFHIQFFGREHLDEMTKNLVVTRIEYPYFIDKKNSTKTFTIRLQNANHTYNIRIKNTGGQIKPNKIQINNS